MSVFVRRNVFFSVLNLLVLAGLSFQAQASRVTDLYKQEILVSGQDEQERKDAMGQALSNVIVKVTGQRGALGLPKIREAQQSPSSYVQSYSYRRDDQNQLKRQLLQISFDRTMVNRLLREADVAIWGSNRPTTLMWLAVDNEGSRQILNSASQLPQVMEAHFQTKGLPMILPLLDFEDSLNISAVDIWGVFTDKIEEASRRYGSEAILTGRLLQNGERYTGRLTLLFRGQRYQAEITDLVAAGVSGVASDLVAKTLAQHYAVTTNDLSTRPILVVNNVKTVEDYAALTEYLDRLTAVREVSAHKIRGSVIELELQIDGTVGQLNDALALGRKLSTETAPVEAKLQNQLFYRWYGR